MTFASASLNFSNIIYYDALRMPEIFQVTMGSHCAIEGPGQTFKKICLQAFHVLFFKHNYPTSLKGSIVNPLKASYLKVCRVKQFTLHADPL